MRLALTAASIALSLLFLVLALRGVEGKKVLAAMKDANWWLLLLCIPNQGLGFFFASERTRFLLRPLRTLPSSHTFRAYMSYFVANNVFPFRMGELLRVDYLARAGSLPHSACLAVVGVERIMDLLVLCGMFFGILPFTSILAGNGLAIPVATGALLVMLGSLYWVANDTERALRCFQIVTKPLGLRVADWLEQRAVRFVSGLVGLRSPLTFAMVLGLSVLFWTTSVFTVQLWIWAFDLGLGLLPAIVVTLALSLGSMIPSAPSSVGTFHFLCKWALMLYSVSPSVATTVGLVGHALVIVPWTVIGTGLVLPTLLRFWAERRSKRPAQNSAQLGGLG